MEGHLVTRTLQVPESIAVGAGLADHIDVWAGSDGISALLGFWPRPCPLSCPVAVAPLPAAAPGESLE